MSQNIDRFPLGIGATLFALAPISLFAPSCSKDNVDNKRCIWTYDRDAECPEYADTGGDEPDDDGSPCAAADGTEPRTVFQCSGSFEAAIDFRLFRQDCVERFGEAACVETVEFGDDLDDYASPAVMACCDAEQATTDDLLTHCGSDFVVQLCRSLPARIDALLARPKLPDGARERGERLRDYISSHQQACYDALYRPTATPGQLEPGRWRIPDGRWRPLQDVSLVLRRASITAATLPEELDEQLACLDAGYNDGELFDEPPPPPPTGEVLGLTRAHGRVQVVGPVLAGVALTGARELELASARLIVSESDELPAWTLHELELAPAGPVTLSHPDLRLTIDQARLRLYADAKGQHAAGTPHVIDPGEALFHLAGVVDGVAGVRLLRNRTPIVLTRDASGWTLAGFELEHVDGLAQTWTVAVPETRWAEPASAAAG